MVEPQQQQQRRRRRPALACWECRRRKIKCDRNEPCAHCARHKTQCVFKPYGDFNEQLPVIGANPVVQPAGQLSRDQSGLPTAPTSSPSASTPSFDSRDSITAFSPLRSAGVASAQTHTESHEQLEPPPRSAASTPGRRKKSTSDHHGPRRSHPRKTRASGGATTANQGDISVVTPESDSMNGCGMRDPSSSLPHRTVGPDPLGPSDSRLSELLRRVQRLEDARSTVAWTGDSLDSVASSLPHGPEINWEDPLVRHAHSRHQLRPREWQVVLNKPRDLGKNRQVGEAPEFAAIISCYSAILGKGSKEVPVHETDIAALYAQAGQSMLNCKNLARRLKMDRPFRGLPQVPTDTGFGSHLVPSSRVVADAMAKLYFQFFESTHRIIHVPTFWADYQRYWDHPETVTNGLRFKVLLVIAIGSSLYDHEDSNAALRNIEMVRPWIYAAETWLTGPLEKDRLDIGGLQIYCLSIIARQIFSIGGDLVWMSMGSIIHRAMQIGLHRDPSYLPNTSVLHSELRRRLWATILDLAVQASLDAWMPPRISFDEFDTEPPSNINDDEMDESTLKIMPHPRTTFTATSTQLALLDSLPVRLRIVQLLNGLHSELSYPRVLAITSELNEALQKCSSLGMMKAKDPEHSYTMDNNQEVTPPTTPFHRSLLDYLVRRFLIPLHYFFSNQARSNPLFHYSLTLSLDAALALISPEPDAGGTFARLMATGGGMFREGLRCAITAISLELLAHVGAQQQSGTLHRAPQHREQIKSAVRDLIALSEERIRHGETNVKSYMFLSMILAQVEAVEAGRGIELAIARSATDSLRFCHDILSARAEACLPLEESDFVAAVEGMDGATPGRMGFEDHGMDWDWDWNTFLPDVGSS